jgi:hypothetical protein
MFAILVGVGAFCVIGYLVFYVIPGLKESIAATVASIIYEIKSHHEK